jgi:hypothetical protein
MEDYIPKKLTTVAVIVVNEQASQNHLPLHESAIDWT